jgi:hypothetical protein
MKLSSAELSEDIAQLRNDISKNVNAIAGELSRDVGIDVSTVQRCTSAVTMLCHSAAQLIPRISQTKAQSLKVGDAADIQAWALLDRVAFDLRAAINQWTKIEELVRLQIPPKRRKLLVDVPEIRQSQLVQYDAVLDQLHELIKPQQQTEGARDHGCFADISLPNSTFLAYVHAAHRVLLTQGRRGPSRFLDVGCGSGFKVMMAARYFDKCVGLEYDKAYVQAAKDLFERAQLDSCHAFEADGLTHTGYDEHDVIYFYRPMRDDDQLRELEKQILAHARPRALIIAPYRVFETRYKDYGCARIQGWLYVKDASESDATILRKNAEMTGSFVGKIQPRGKSIWDPILAASATKGFGF